jgi:phosphinothricin acetyltransferase
VETSVYVDQNSRTKGVGSALYKQLLEMLKAQGFIMAVAGITLPNDASERIHASFGFKPIGSYKSVGYKCDTWHDVGFFEVELNPPAATPNEPLGLQAVANMVAR